MKVRGDSIFQALLAIIGLLALAESSSAADFFVGGSVTNCTRTCSSVAAWNATADVYGYLQIDTGANDTWTYSDVQDSNTVFFNPGAPLEDAIFAPAPDPRCNGLEPGIICNLATANPLPFDVVTAPVRKAVNLVATGGTTNSAGDLESGVLLFELLAPSLKLNEAWMVIEFEGDGAARGRICLFYETAGCIPGSTEFLTFTIESQSDFDTDNDGVYDNVDNCDAIENASQLDSDDDNIGNACDADFDNDCFVGFSDLSVFADEFGQAGEGIADIDGNGFVNFADLGLFADLFGETPGQGEFEPNICDGMAKTVDATAFGNYANTVQTEHQVDTYRVGSEPGECKQFASYVVFDLAELPTGPLQTVELRLRLPGGGYTSNELSEDIVVFDVTSDIDDLITGAINAFVDLDSGTLFASASINESSEGTVIVFELNEVAIMSLPLRQDRIAFGLTLANIRLCEDTTVFGDTVGAPLSWMQLQIEYGL